MQSLFKKDDDQFHESLKVKALRDTRIVKLRRHRDLAILIASLQAVFSLLALINTFNSGIGFAGCLFFSCVAFVLAMKFESDMRLLILVDTLFSKDAESAPDKICDAS